MAIDFFAVATQGYFPTPTPSAAARMAYAATWGYLGTVPTGAAGILRGLFRLGMRLVLR